MGKGSGELAYSLDMRYPLSPQSGGSLGFFRTSFNITKPRYKRVARMTPLHKLIARSIVYSADFATRGVESQLALEDVLRRQDYFPILRRAKSAKFTPFTIGSAADDSRKSAKLTGPIQFVEKLLKTWRLTPKDAVPLLGGDQDYVSRLLRGSAQLAGRDIKDRIAYLFRIRQTLSSLFRDEDTENEWLREPHELLNGTAPLQLLREGSLENMLTVKEYVDAVAGR